MAISNKSECLLTFLNFFHCELDTSECLMYIRTHCILITNEIGTVLIPLDSEEIRHR